MRLGPQVPAFRARQTDRQTTKPCGTAKARSLLSLTHLSDLVSTRAGDFMPALSCSAWAANGSQTLGTSNQEGENSCKTDEGGRGPPRSRSLTACVIAAASAAAAAAVGRGRGRAGRVGIMTKVTSTCAPQSLSSLAVPPRPRPSALQTVPKPEETSTSFIPRRNGGLESGQTRSSHFPSPSQSRLGWDGTREPDMHSGLSGSFQFSG